MIQLRRSAAVILMLSFIVACAPKEIPPELKPSYTRLEVLQRVQELQNTVIGLYDSNPRGITKDKADLIVKFTIVASDAVADSAQGWQASLKASWNGLNQQIGITIPKGLETIWKLIDAMIGVL